jgi:ferredoxin
MSPAVNFTIVLDETLCELHGECVLVAPAIFEIDDDDAERVTVNLPHPGNELRLAAEEAVENCPMRALRLDA